MTKPPRLHPHAGRLSALLAMVVALSMASALPVSTIWAVQKSRAEIQLKFGVKVAQRGSWNEAAFRFERAVEADATNPRAWCNLAVARESLGQFDAAREAYEKASELDPRDERIRANYERFQNYMKSNRKAGSAP